MGIQQRETSGMTVSGDIHRRFGQVTIDTRTVSPDKRLGFWRDRVNSPTGLDVQCVTDNFLAWMQSRDLGQCSIHGVKIETAHRAARRKANRDVVFANVQVSNDGARYNGPREYAMNGGSLVIYEAGEPYELEFDGSSEGLILAIPRSELQKRVANLNLHLEEAIDYDPAKVTLLGQLMRGVLSTRPNVPEAVTDGLSESLISLLVATLYDTADIASRSPTQGVAGTLQRAKAHIKANIADPDLNPASTAEAMGITVSYLHKVFMLSNTTLMQYVLAERLEHCRRDIAKADWAGGMSQIAYAWGFNDASHFSRSFRKRFGVSPREYRADVLSRNKLLRT